MLRICEEDDFMMDVGRLEGIWRVERGRDVIVGFIEAIGVIVRIYVFIP